MWRDIDAYVANAPSISVKLTRIDKKLAQRRKEQFDINCRVAFRKRIRGPKMGLEIHHVVPLSLNGSNNHSNLVLVEHDLHAAIHRLIDPQMADMQTGESRLIRLPYFTQRIWRYER